MSILDLERSVQGYNAYSLWADGSWRMIGSYPDCQIAINAARRQSAVWRVDDANTDTVIAESYRKPASTDLTCKRCGCTLPAIPGYEGASWRHCHCNGIATS